MTAWLLVLNDFAVPDVWASDFADSVPDILQMPILRLNPELQVAQTEESETVHIWQFTTVHFLTVKLIIFRAGLDTPEIVESM